ncbi:MAG: hypothetical protein KAS32_23865 [Candidatus Peribacteraceae bacterium]|nr:hypothetical protein [Candidatus Peribacteraceae bacterium]
MSNSLQPLEKGIKMGSAIYSKEFKNQIRRTAYQSPELTQQEIADLYGVSLRSVRRWCKELDPEALEGNVGEIIKENVRLSKNKQHLADRNRIERKSFREYARAEGMVEALNEALIHVLDNHKFTSCENKPKIPIIDEKDGSVGIIQISDNHLNELIKDTEGNIFDFDIAAKRLHKFATKAIDIFLANGVDRVCIAFTGDQINSDRRISEITAAAVPRANAVLLAVDLYHQMIDNITEYFDVTVTSITGNESRVKEFIDWTNYLASDSYDILIHNILSYLYADSNYVTFAPIQNPLEQVLHVNGVNILMVHGNAHKGIANTAKIETEVEKIKSRYSTNGVKIDYVIMGYIHSAYIGDMFARSSGLPGNNAFSERALNMNGRASQNIYIVEPDGAINGMRIDLQNTDGYDGFAVNKQLVEYNPQAEKQLDTGTTIFRVVI